ncbi:queuosine precursor transporter [Patescibacteria group bacterium]
MTLYLIIIWIIGITSFTLLGAWYARKFNKPDLLIAIYVTFVLIAQILAIKIAAFNLIINTYYVPAGVLVFSVSFLITDIVNEKFGRKETHKMIFIAFITQIALVLFIWLGTSLPAAPFWPMQETWQSIFGFVPRIVIASWIAFLISENLDAWIYAWFKKLTKGKHLWTRNVFSSFPALFLDSIIFIIIAFGGIMPIFSLIIGQTILKWLVGLINIPFMYLNKHILTKQ